jgi:uncharacterized protein
MSPLQFNVAQLLLEPIGSTRDFSAELDYIEAQQNLLNVHGAQGSVHMIRTHRGILVQALFHAQTSLNCGRCLSDYMWNSSMDIEEEFLPEFDLVTGRSVDIEPDEDALFHIDGDHILDLTEALRQYAIAGQPMKPLCNKDCSGLCHSCGVNLDLERCSCSGDAIDPRWGALASLTFHDDN